MGQAAPDEVPPAGQDPSPAGLAPPAGQNAPAAGPSAPAEEPTPSVEERVAPLEKRIGELENELEELREANELHQDDEAFQEQRLSGLASLKEKISGYIDVGFFWAQGNGSGLRTDTGNRIFPEYDYVTSGWVFLGDPLSTAINARGEPADTGDSRALANDTVNAGSEPSFIVNTVSFSFFHGLSDSLSVETTIDMMPRTRSVSQLGGTFRGQFFDIRRAYLEYVAPFSSVELHILAGKFDSVLGREYRSQEAPNRIPVTPSLICRYTCGQPLGLKARALFLEGDLVLNTSLTNGGHGIADFPFRDEIDSNAFKTLAGRLSYRLPVGSGLEIGASGSYGAQDGQEDNGVRHWQFGFDLAMEWNNLLVRAEFHRGLAPGATEDPDTPCDTAECLEYKGFYALIGYRARRGWIPYARVDWRDALHRHGTEFVYVSKLIRTTAGVRKEFGPHLVTKLEYTLNLELGPLPQADNNVLTSSVVVRY